MKTFTGSSFASLGWSSLDDLKSYSKLIYSMPKDKSSAALIKVNQHPDGSSGSSFIFLYSSAEAQLLSVTISRLCKFS